MRESVNASVDGLKISVVEAEVAELAQVIAVYEKTCAAVRRLAVPESVGHAGRNAMFKVIEDELVQLHEASCGHYYFQDEYFDQIMDMADVGGLFNRFEYHIYGNNSKAGRDLFSARNELLASLCGVYEKIRDLSGACLEACKESALRVDIKETRGNEGVRMVEKPTTTSFPRRGLSQKSNPRRRESIASHGSEPSQGRWLVFSTIVPHREELFFSFPLCSWCALWFKSQGALKPGYGKDFTLKSVPLIYFLIEKMGILFSIKKYSTVEIEIVREQTP